MRAGPQRFSAQSRPWHLSSHNKQACQQSYPRTATVQSPRASGHLWNLRGPLHSQDHGQMSLYNDDRDVDEFIDELQLRNLWNLHGFLHSEGHAHLSLHNNDRDVDEFVQEVQLWNLHGSLHSQDHGHQTLQKQRAGQQLCPRSAPVESPRDPRRFSALSRTMKQQRACKQPCQELQLRNLHELPRVPQSAQKNNHEESRDEHGRRRFAGRGAPDLSLRQQGCRQPCR